MSSAPTTYSTGTTDVVAVHAPESGWWLGNWGYHLPQGMDMAGYQSYVDAFKAAAPSVNTIRFTMSEKVLDGPWAEDMWMLARAYANAGFKLLIYRSDGDMADPWWDDANESASGIQFDLTTSRDEKIGTFENPGTAMQGWQKVFDQLNLPENEIVKNSIYGFEFLNEPAAYDLGSTTEIGWYAEDALHFHKMVDRFIETTDPLNIPKTLIGGLGFQNQVQILETATLTDPVTGLQTDALSYIRDNIPNDQLVWAMHYYSPWWNNDVGSFIETLGKARYDNVIITEMHQADGSFFSVDPDHRTLEYGLNLETWARSPVKMGLSWWWSTSPYGWTFMYMGAHGTYDDYTEGRGANMTQYADWREGEEWVMSVRYANMSTMLNYFFVANDLGAEAVVSGQTAGTEDAATFGTVYGDVIYSFNDHSLLLGGLGDDRLVARDGEAFLHGHEGNDTLDGSDLRDMLAGGEGADLLIGNGGNDLLVGGAGADVFKYDASAQSGADTIVDFTSGVDIIWIVGFDPSQATVVVTYEFDNIPFTTITWPTGSIRLERIDGFDLNDIRTSPSLPHLAAIAPSVGYYVRLNDGADTFEGTALNDTLFGNGGHDSIWGGAGDDAAYGGAGADRLWGGAGRDVLGGGSGSDVLYGGDGDDTLSGDDTAAAMVGAGDDVLYGGAGRDVLSGGAGDDALFGGLDADTLYGGAGDDTIAFGAGDVLYGGAGNDVFVLEAGQAAGGRVFLFGGDGALGESDLLDLRGFANAAVSFTSATSGTAFVTNASGDAVEIIFTNVARVATDQGGIATGAVDGGAGNDSIGAGFVDAQGDVIGADGDNVDSGAGNDTIDGAGGNDTLAGGAGDDSLNGGASGRDLLYGGGGDDVLAGGNDVDTLYGGAGSDTLRGDGTGTSLAGDTLFGGGGNDWLIAAERAGAGASYLDGGDDADTLQGGSGNDTLLGDTGDDSLSGGDGDDSLRGGDGRDTVLGGAGNDVIYGDLGADVLAGGAGNDTLYGGAGDDVITVGAGDLAYGGDGDDLFRIDPSLSGTAAITIVGGEGPFDPFDEVNGNRGDILDLRGLTNLRLTRGANEAGTATFTNSAGQTVSLTYSEIENVLLDDPAPITGTAAGDSIGPGYVDAAGRVVDGGASTADTIYGGGGNDTINGGAAGDTIYGGDGGDSIVGGPSGRDLIYGDAGADTLFGHNEADTIYGGAGNDVIRGDGLGTSSIGDSLFGGDGDDLIYAVERNPATSASLLDGGAGHDTLYGSTFADTLIGGGGNDRLYGGEGDDLLRMGAGAWAEGGAGNDTFRFDAAWAGAGQITVIGGEAAGDTDVLDLRGLGAVTVLRDGANPETGTASYINSAGQSVSITFSQIETILSDVSGTAGNDTLTIGSTDANGNQIDGAQGNDNVISGGAGNDSLNAGLGNDTVYGGLGNDIIDGGAGSDALFGDGGRDTIYGNADDDIIRGGAENDVLYGGAGNDTLIADGTGAAGGADRLFGGDGNDTLYAAESDTVTLGALLDGGHGHDNLFGSIADDTIYGGFSGRDGLFGGAGNDLLRGGMDRDQLFGGAGDDTIWGDGFASSRAEDRIFGGDGNDLIYATELADAVAGSTLHGDAGDDTVFASTHNDMIYGGAGRDRLLGGLGNDTIIGGADADTLYGEAGRDTLWLSAGDIAYGGGGDDTFHITATEPVAGTINIYGGDEDETPYDPVTRLGGGDTLDLRGLSAVVLNQDPTDPKSGTAQYITPDGQSVTINFWQIERILLPSDRQVSTYGGDDFLVAGFADAQGDQIDGQDGMNDLVLAGAGNDTVHTGAGHDRGYGGAGDDLVEGGDGNDTLFGDDGRDTLSGATGDDSLDGGTGNDVLLGGAGNDSLSGGIGSDSLDGGEGDDLLLGGDGADTLLGNIGNDSLEGGNGHDSLIGGAGQDTLLGGIGNDSLGGGDGDDSLMGGDGADSIVAGDGNDTIYGGAGNDTVDAGAGDDFINTRTALGAGLPNIGQTVLGNPAASYPADPSPADDEDLIFAGLGHDTILSGDDNDTIYGDAGNDSIDGGFDDDLVFGGAGNDAIAGNEGRDTLYGGDGDDTIFGGLANTDPDFAQAAVFDLPDANGGDPAPLNNIDLLFGGAGQDLIFGGEDADTLYGGLGNDSLYGDMDDDRLFGDDGSDSLIGGAGNDTLDGGAGDDNIRAGAGDVAFGGAGDDVFTIDPTLAGNAGITIVGGEADEESVIDPTNNEGGRIGDVLDLRGAGNVQVVYNQTDPTWNGTTSESGTARYLNAAGEEVTITFSEIESVVVCFARGTMIDTAEGEKPIEDLMVGDLVRTADHDYQPIRWIGSSKVAAVGHIAPILIKAGALGNTRDLRVSPQHRMLLGGWQAQMLFGDDEVLVAAKHLVNDSTILRMESGEVEYYHMLFDTHEIVFAEGAPSESFHPGQMGWGALAEESRAEILELFPELATGDFAQYGASARRSLKAYEASLAALRLMLG